MMFKHEGMNNLLKQLDDPTDASETTPGCHHQGSPGGKISGDYHYHHGWRLGDSSCWCHSTLASHSIVSQGYAYASQSSGKRSVELLIKGMRKIGAAAPNASCDVEFNTQIRVSMRPMLNGSTGRYEPRVLVSPIVPSQQQ